ncbi:MAG: hypothetical protein WC279_11695, partial [Sulfurimonas sp.]|jgi:hypothetical protein
MEMSPEEEELVANLAAQGLDENQIMEVLAGIEEESAMLEEAQEAQADAIVEELSAQGLAPEEILEVVAANAEEEAMAEAQQDQIAAMHGYVPYLDKQAGVWQDTLKRILSPVQRAGRAIADPARQATGMYKEKMKMSHAGRFGGRLNAGVAAGKRMWNSGAMGQAQMIGAPVAGIAGLGAAGYAAMPEPTWQDRFAALQGYNPYIDKRAAVAATGKKVLKAVTAPFRDMAWSAGQNRKANLSGLTKVRNVLRAGWNPDSPYRNVSRAAMVGAPALGVAGLGGAGYAAFGPEDAPWYTPEGIRDMLAYNNAYNQYLDKQANAFTQGVGRIGNQAWQGAKRWGRNTGQFMMKNPMVPAAAIGIPGLAYAINQGVETSRPWVAGTAVGLGAGAGSMLGTLGGGLINGWEGAGQGAVAGSLLGALGGGAAGYYYPELADSAYKNAGYDQYNPYFDALAAYGNYNPYMDKTAANWGALAAPAWGAVKGFGQRAGQFVKGLPGMAAANPWATAGIGAGLATGIGAGAYGLMNQEPSPDEQEFVEWLLNTPEGQQYLAAAAGGLGGAALGAGAGYMAGGGMGAGIGAGLGALGGGFAGYNMPDYTGQY